MNLFKGTVGMSFFECIKTIYLLNSKRIVISTDRRMSDEKPLGQAFYESSLNEIIPDTPSE